jgi:hypothetical protein
MIVMLRFKYVLPLPRFIGGDDAPCDCLRNPQVDDLEPNCPDRISATGSLAGGGQKKTVPDLS